ncbi:hypothetical protein SAMN05518872_101632 [Psychrobacillus sp. OK032]|nr:hypothetical protein SAMN05518872_101632 [Psychrobacillus sp. OK032]
MLLRKMIAVKGGDSSGGQQDVGHEGVEAHRTWVMQLLPQDAANLDCLPFIVAHLAFVPLVRQMNLHNVRASGGDGSSLAPRKASACNGNQLYYGIDLLSKIAETLGS